MPLRIGQFNTGLGQMFYTTDKNDHGLRYNPFKAIVSPRPIAWVSSKDSDGNANLAPYSFFNGMSDMPPVIGFGSGPMKMGVDEPKDSLTNIATTGEFCVSIVSDALKNQMNISSQHVPHRVDEFELAGLRKAQARTIDVPFVADSPVTLECKLHEIITLPGTSKWVIGLVQAVHIHDEFIVDGKLDVTKYQPVARLGYKDYATISETYELERPK
jgi:flavin reductase (DIM6/NTAB) family NADH-FMN oxidoreductase RutF